MGKLTGWAFSGLPFENGLPKPFSNDKRAGISMGSPQNPMILWGEEEQGSGRSFRRKAETEVNGLCDDDTQGLQALVRNAVTLNSPDLDGLGCSCLAERTYGVHPV